MPMARAMGERLLSTPLIPVAVAIALGLFDLASKPLWLDETTAIAIARLPTLDMLIHLWRVELHASPYYIALHAWLALGDSAFVVRLLSVVFGAAGVAATWAIGRRYGTAFPAALLLAVTPGFVEFQQEARGYTLLIAAAALTTLLFLRMLEAARPARVALYVGAAAALIYFHPLASLIVLAHALWVVVGTPAPRRWRLLVVFVPVVIGWLPMIRFALNNRDRIAWVPPTTLENSLATLAAVGGGLVLAPLALVLIVLKARRDHLTLWLAVPLVGTIVASLLVQPMLQARYLLGVLPAGALIIARHSRPVLAVFIALSLVGTWGWYARTDVKDDWGAIAAHVASGLQPGDGIVFAPDYLRAGFGYHARVGESIWPPLDWSVSDLRHGPLEDGLERLAAAERVWLVRGHAADLPHEIDARLAAMQVLEVRPFPGPHEVRVSLLIPGPD